MKHIRGTRKKPIQGSWSRLDEYVCLPPIRYSALAAVRLKLAFLTFCWEYFNTFIRTFKTTHLHLQNCVVSIEQVVKGLFDGNVCRYNQLPVALFQFTIVGELVAMMRVRQTENGFE